MFNVISSVPRPVPDTQEVLKNICCMNATGSLPSLLERINRVIKKQRDSSLTPSLPEECPGRFLGG